MESILGLEKNTLTLSDHFSVRHASLIISIRILFTKKVPQIDFIDSIYHAEVEDILDLISGLEPECESIMVVGHNPSMHLISEYLSGNFIEKYPTCGLCWLTITDNWEEIKQGCGTLKLFMKPSQLR